MNLQAKENTWSHQRRKRRQKQLKETVSSLATTDDSGYAISGLECKNRYDADELPKIATDESRTEFRDQENRDQEVMSVKDSDMSVSKGETDLSAVEMKTGVVSDEIHCKSQKTFNSNCNNNSTSVNVKTDKAFTLAEDTQIETSASTEDGHGCKRKLENTCKDNIVPSKKTRVDDMDENHSRIAEDDKSKTDLKNAGNNIEGKNIHVTDQCTDIKDETKTENSETIKLGAGDTEVSVQESGNESQEIAMETSVKVSSDKPGSETEVCGRTETDAELKVEEKMSFDDYLSEVKSHIPAGLESTQYNEGSCSVDELNSPETLSRKDVLEQFHQEQEKNLEIAQANKDQTKKTKYHNFDENEQCLVLFKMVLRKEEGIITLTMEHKVGNKEAMHQIMQYFKNKFSVLSPQK